MKFFKNLYLIFFIFSLSFYLSVNAGCGASSIGPSDQSISPIEQPQILELTEADIDNGITLFHKAYVLGMFDVLRCLLGGSANRDALLLAQTKTGFTVLHWAVLDKNKKVVQLIHDNISSEIKWVELICLKNYIQQSPASIVCDYAEDFFGLFFGEVSAEDEELKTVLDAAVANLDVIQVSEFISLAKRRKRNLTYLYWVVDCNFKRVQVALGQRAGEETDEKQILINICDLLLTFLQLIATQFLRS